METPKSPRAPRRAHSPHREMLKTSAHRLARSRSERRNERAETRDRRGNERSRRKQHSSPRGPRKKAKSAPRPAVVCGAAALGSGALQICSQETLAASQRLLRAPSSPLMPAAPAHQRTGPPHPSRPHPSCRHQCAAPPAGRAAEPRAGGGDPRAAPPGPADAARRGAASSARQRAAPHGARGCLSGLILRIATSKTKKETTEVRDLIVVTLALMTPVMCGASSQSTLTLDCPRAGTTS